MTDVKSVVFALCMAVCGTAFVYKLRDLRSSGYDPALCALLAAFAFKCIAFLIAIPAVCAEIDRRLEIPNISALVGIHIFGGVIFGGCVLATLLFWHEPPPRAWPRVCGLTIVAGLVSMVMILLWAADGVKDRATHYLVQNGSRGLLASIYLLVYVTALLVTLGLIVYLCWGYAKKAEIMWLQRGLRTTILGALIYAVSPLDRLSVLIVKPLGIDPLKWEILVPFCTGTGVLLIVSGLTMPSWGPCLSAMLDWVKDYRTHRKLYPLWCALRQAIPEIALHPASSSRVRNLRYHVYRQIVEIRDARLTLRPHMDSHVAVLAAQRGTEVGLDGDELAAVVEAAQLKVALRSRIDDCAPGLSSPVDESEVRGGDDISSEVAWLLQVARAYTRSPVVAAMDRAPVRNLP